MFRLRSTQLFVSARFCQLMFRSLCFGFEVRSLCFGFEVRIRKILPAPLSFTGGKTKHLSLYIYIYIYIHVCIYIYIYRERERDVSIYIWYIYIYIYIQRERERCIYLYMYLSLSLSLFLPYASELVGWHYSSNATCLMRPRVFSSALLV